MKSRIGELFVQIISVMIGVFLGFIISNWSENKKETVKFDLLMENLTSEIENNRNKVSQVIDYHKTLRDSTRFYLKQEELIKYQPAFFKGVNTLTFSNSAFDTAIQTGLINDMPVENIQLLNEIYTQQRSYEEFANLLLSGLIVMDFDNTERFAKKLLVYLSISMTDIVIKEEQLLESYENALSVITKKD